MARPAHWPCLDCRRILGAVDARGSLIVDAGRVIVRPGPVVLEARPTTGVDERGRRRRELLIA
jgi:hypothetical protein